MTDNKQTSNEYKSTTAYDNQFSPDPNPPEEYDDHWHDPLHGLTFQVYAMAGAVLCVGLGGLYLVLT